MQTIRPVVMWGLVVVAALMAKDSDARRLGAKSSSSSSAPVVRVEPAKEAAEKRRQDEARAQRAADEERQAELKRQALAREMSCVIKPVMSDPEIAQCKWAWSSQRP